eukprot:GAHX01001597.1.p1 GENE.GAHX01001597.1~~GAHX01001597.1.p1  ORF type:complete len:122 (-),score=22.22 GAHX01001597.1:88-453(-)
MAKIPMGVDNHPVDFFQIQELLNKSVSKNSGNKPELLSNSGSFFIKTVDYIRKINTIHSKEVYSSIEGKIRIHFPFMGDEEKAALINAKINDVDELNNLFPGFKTKYNFEQLTQLVTILKI